MSELPYFSEPETPRTGMAPPPDTLVAMVSLSAGPDRRTVPTLLSTTYARDRATAPIRLPLPPPPVLVRPGPAGTSAVAPALRSLRSFPVPRSIPRPPAPRLVSWLIDRIQSASAWASGLTRALTGGTAARIGLVLAVALAASWPSLGAILDDVRQQRVGSHLLVALLTGALVLGIRARMPFREPNIHDRDVDWLLALPMFAAAAFFVTAVADRIGPAFGREHLGLLAVPVLVAATTVLVFGTRAMWRLRLPLVLISVALLPMPDRWVNALVRATSLPLADTLAATTSAFGLDVDSVGPVLVIGTGGTRTLDLAADASGLAGPLSMLIVAALLATVVTGPVASVAGRARSVRVTLLVVGIAGGWVLLDSARALGFLLLTAHGDSVGPTTPLAVVADVSSVVLLVGVGALLAYRARAHRPGPGRARFVLLTRTLNTTAVLLTLVPSRTDTRSRRLDLTDRVDETDRAGAALEPGTAR